MLSVVEYSKVKIFVLQLRDDSCRLTTLQTNYNQFKIAK